jgi:uroporphyrin-III C-methyltransferase / precorrin-2 dehydrogenase / sirohydrochlorin ferrochelatase
VQYLTGHGADGRLPDDICWAAVADPTATTVLYMPRRTLREFVIKATAAGLSPETTALAVAAATRPGQRFVTGAIKTLPDLIGTLPVGEPVVVVIGAVAGRVPASEKRYDCDPRKDDKEFRHYGLKRTIPLVAFA